MNIIIKEIRVSEELRAKIEYWRTWNVPRHPEITEGASDCACRDLARAIHAELERMNEILRLINREAHGITS